MNYIIFDLEWNQSPQGEEIAPGEIIEIGAVKLDDRFAAVDELRCYVKPFLYPTLHKRIASLTGIRLQDLQEKGVPFPEAYGKFMQWCGEDCVWMTWSPSDLPILIDNLLIHGMDVSNLPDYCDIQRIFSREIMRHSTQYSLETALAILKETGEAAHDALHDARNTAKICAHLELENYLGEYTGRIFAEQPNGKIYDTRRALLSDPELSRFFCPRCGGVVQCEPWVSFGHNTFAAYGICPEEDEFLMQLLPEFRCRGELSAKRVFFELTDDLWDIYLDKKEAAQGIIP